MIQLAGDFFAERLNGGRQRRQSSGEISCIIANKSKSIWIVKASLTERS